MFEQYFVRKYECKNDNQAMLMINKGLEVGDLYDIGVKIQAEAAELIKKHQENKVKDKEEEKVEDEQQERAEPSEDGVEEQNS